MKKPVKDAVVVVERLLATCENARERRELLGDWFTDAELIDFAERWEIVRRLLDGTPQRTVRDEVGVSISLVTRASTALKNAGKGFRRAHGKLHAR